MEHWKIQLIVGAIIVIVSVGYGIARFLSQFGSEHKWRLELSIRCIKCQKEVARVHCVEMIHPFCTVKGEVHCADCLTDTVDEEIKG
jgi:hypothetical protein